MVVHFMKYLTQETVHIFFLFSPFSLLLLSWFFFKLLFVKDRDIPLHIAAANGCEEVVKILIEHGSNIDLQDQVLIFFVILVTLM